MKGVTFPTNKQSQIKINCPMTLQTIHSSYTLDKHIDELGAKKSHPILYFTVTSNLVPYHMTDIPQFIT